MTEQEPSPIEKSAVIESFRADPENLEIFLVWLLGREAEVALENSSAATLRLNIEIAEIYRDAGLREQALSAFLDALDQASQERNDEACAQLLKEVEKLEEAQQEE